MAGFFGCASLVVIEVGRSAGEGDGPALALAVAAAMVAADLLSGLVHWAGDTWGSADWPIVGHAIIRGFREHHVDPLAITGHDFVEANGSNCLLSLPLLAIALGLGESRGALFVRTFLTALALGILFTTQIHKWAHTREPPRGVALLQRLGVILSAERHALHHRAPFDGHYCITNGWLNSTLDRARVFRKLEELVSLTTGAEPRAEDPASPHGGEGGGEAAG
jgi:ubiquitin-conjugating enzyme E2 variant